MKTAVIIDDLDHALIQIEHAFPKNKRKRWNFVYFDSIELFRNHRFHLIDVVFLDFYISKNKMYGLDMLS